MPTVAYLTNLFPAEVEPYVIDEIRELRRRGLTIIPCSARRQNLKTITPDLQRLALETMYLQPLSVPITLRAIWLGMRNLPRIKTILCRILLQGKESPSRRLRALLHTFLGCCYAVRLQKLGVKHIHAHHGYFSSWIAMVAARLLGIDFSLTLHGSDLLLHAAYLDTKLEACSFCTTISEFNRRHILEHYPYVDT